MVLPHTWTGASARASEYRCRTRPRPFWRQISCLPKATQKESFKRVPEITERDQIDHGCKRVNGLTQSSTASAPHHDVTHNPAESPLAAGRTRANRLLAGTVTRTNTSQVTRSSLVLLSGVPLRRAPFTGALASAAAPARVCRCVVGPNAGAHSAVTRLH